MFRARYGLAGRGRCPIKATGALLRALAIAWSCALLAGCIVVDYEQRRWIYQPTDQVWEPAVEAARGMQDVWIDFVSDHPEQRGATVRLHGLWLPQPEATAPVLLFLHGVRWDVRASALRMRQLHAHGFGVLAVDYRGFGQSTPFLPSETLIAEDVLAAWDWLARNHPLAPRYVFGHSLGASIAVRLASEVADESGLIVEGAFTSSIDVLRSTRWGWLPVEWLITQRLDAGSRIAQVGSPVLVVHGSEDTMVDPALGRALYDRALPPKQFLLVQGAVHEDVDVVGFDDYRRALRALFGVGTTPGKASVRVPVSAGGQASAPDQPGSR